MIIKQKPLSARFINCFSAGFGDYTEERKKVFDKYSVDDIVREVKKEKSLTVI